MIQASISYMLLDPVRDGRNFRLHRTVVYSYGDDSWTVPAGFVTDLTSVPWFARWLVGRWGKYGWAAVLHDAAYRGMFPGMTREQADYLFLVFMRVCNTPAWQQVALYGAVRVFGWLFWQRVATDFPHGK